MAEPLILVIESRDEVGTVEHVRSMAENEAKVKRWWTLYGMSQYHRTGCDRLASYPAQAEGSARRNQHHATRQSAQRTIAACRWFV
jgi:hypothetical protein